MASSDTLPDIPELALSIPPSSLLQKGAAFIKDHMAKSTAAHCYRMAYWALIIAKHPRFAGVEINMEAVLYAVIMHDLGFSPTLASKDKRFEVDGANIARDFISKYASDWTRQDIQLVWDAIALHTTPSIAHNKEPEVALTQLAVMIDLFGPDFPGDFVTKEQFIAVCKVFPRKDLQHSMPLAFCGICKTKPDTTYDNFVQEFGLIMGYDGNGEGREEYTKMVEANRFSTNLMKALKGLEEWEASGFASS